MAELLKPVDLRTITSDAEMEKMDEERRLKEKAKRQAEELREAFMSREIQPEAIDRINAAVSTAARNGQTQLQVLTFPSSYCTDGGRAINVADPEWPSTLQGFAQKAIEFYRKELKPLGYKIHAEIISFPDGMPGDVGLYLRW